MTKIEFSSENNLDGEQDLKNESVQMDTEMMDEDSVAEEQSQVDSLEL